MKWFYQDPEREITTSRESERGGDHQGCLLPLELRLGLGEAVDKDGEDYVHNYEAREEGPRDEVGGNCQLRGSESKGRDVEKRRARAVARKKVGAREGEGI